MSVRAALIASLTWWVPWRLPRRPIFWMLGAIGLVAPMATGIAPFLTRVAAVCLATLMGGAVATHVMRREPAATATILAVLTIVVATFR